MISLSASRIPSFQVVVLTALVIAGVGFFAPLTTHALAPSSPEIIDDGGDDGGDGGGTTPAAATVSMAATPTSVQQGYASQLSYSSSSVSSCSINNGVGSVTANTSGYKTVSPSSTITYTITCQASAGGSVTATATVTVTAAPTPLTAYCEAGPDIAQVNETVQWYATHSTGSSANLAWDRGVPFTTKICTGGQNYSEPNSTCPEYITEGDSCSVEGQRCKESAGCDGSTYTDGEGQSNAHTQYGSVTPYTCVASNTSATYSFAWTGTDGLSGITQNVSKAYAAIGMKTARVTVTRNTGGSGTTSGYGWRAVGSQTGPTCTSDVNSVTGGVDHRSQPTCSASTVGTRYTQYNIEAATQSTCPSAYRNNEYSVTGQEYVCEANSSSTAGTASASCSAEIVSKTPTATLTANPSSITKGSSSTLSWSSTNANACTLNEGIGSVATSGTRSVTPGSTTTYTLMCAAPSSGSTAGTWQYYDSDISDFSCPVTDTNKAYSSVPNCPSNPQGKACTGGSGMTVCKKNTVNGCNINTDLYQCQTSPSSPPQVATASATVTVNNSVAACYQASTKRTICVDGLNKPGDNTCTNENPACPSGIMPGGYYLVTGQSCLAGSMQPGGGVQHWPGHEFTKVNESFCRASQADLTAGSITPTSATAGSPVTFSSTISNPGTLATGVTSPVLFQRATNSSGANATSLGITNTASLVAGESRAVTRSATLTAGTWYLRACADNDASFVGTIAESDENNNCGAWTAVTVSTAAAPTVSCTVSPTSVSPGGSVTYRANPAGGASAPFTWAASDGASMGTAATASRTFSTPGTYAMNVRASGTAVSYCPNVVVAASWCTNRPTDLSITATPNRVRSGQSVALAWSATGVNGENATCTVSGPGVSWSSLVTGVPQCSASGSANTTIQTQSTYTLTCGAYSESVTVNVIPGIREF